MTRMGGLVIGFYTFLALFAYLIAPDSSPEVNEQFPELALLPPGSTVPMLKVRRNQPIPPANLWRKALRGSETPWKWYPAEHYRIVGDSLFLQPIDRAPIAFHLMDVRYAVNNDNGGLRRLDGVSTPKIDTESWPKQIEQRHWVNRTFWLGTDKFGRCLLSRLLVGTRISLSVGLIAVGISLSLGCLLGALAGYLGGRVDNAIMLLINTVWSIPTLLLVFALVLALGRHPANVFVAVGLTMWVDVARLVRGQIIDLKQIAFVEAARSMGFSSIRIITRHLLPNLVGPIMVIAAANFAMAILIEAGLSYLGFGIRPPQPSWGNMLNENYGFALSGKWYLALIPSLAIMSLVLAFNLLGTGLRDLLDVRRNN